MNEPGTLYNVLGVGEQASQKIIRSAFRTFARCFHPDKGLGLPVDVQHRMEERFKEIHDAYSVLKDPEKRAEYDGVLAMLRSGEFYVPPPLPKPKPKPTPPPQRSWNGFSYAVRQPKAYDRSTNPYRSALRKPRGPERKWSAATWTLVWTLVLPPAFVLFMAFIWLLRFRL